ncbi:zinc protease [Neisseria sp. HSC-16F19]|nr:pitrilysin family protein [Neisseria sp. HSC-16F19]MCP2041806.1 zinc protease [Neisseria sp. HSC-16F19]
MPKKSATRPNGQFALALLLTAAAPTAHAIDIQRWPLACGGQVLLVERHDNPIVDIDIAFHAGSAYDHVRKPGVADMANGLLDTGTDRDDEETLRARISDLAATISSYGELERGGLRIRSLSEKATLGRVTTLANRILSRPRFDDAVLQREKQRAIAGLKQGLTQPRFIASRRLSLLNYPDGHPYGLTALESEDSIAAISRADVQDFHREHYRAQEAVVAVVGDINRADTEKLVKKLLAGLPENCRENPPHSILNATAARDGQHQSISHPASQAHIMLGMPLITRKDPDYYALIVGNYILGGGGFDSRLMKVLRDDKGYTYGAGSSLSPLHAAGPLTIGFSTQKAQAAEALAASRQVIADFIAQGPTEAELQQAKDNIIGGFPLRFDSNAKLIGYLSVMGIYGLPDDFLDAYPERVRALSREDIRRVWQQRVDTKALNSVIVGSTSPTQ